MAEVDNIKRGLIDQITQQNNLLTKIRTMLLQDDISLQDCKIMRFESDERLVRLEAKLKVKIKVEPENLI